MRTFISINLNDLDKKEIHSIQNQVKSQILSADKTLLKKISWTDKDKFHITLFFIGEVNENKVKDIDLNLTNLKLSSYKEIGFSFKGINAFPKLRYPRVLIAELLNEDNRVSDLSERINDSMQKAGFINDKKFHPHITLGRIKRENKINLTGLFNEVKSGLKFSASEFYLMKSELKSTGAEYSVINKYNF